MGYSVCQRAERERAQRWRPPPSSRDTKRKLHLIEIEAFAFGSLQKVQKSISGRLHAENAVHITLRWLRWLKRFKLVEIGSVDRRCVCVCIQRTVCVVKNFEIAYKRRRGNFLHAKKAYGINRTTATGNTSYVLHPVSHFAWISPTKNKTNVRKLQHSNAKHVR